MTIEKSCFIFDPWVGLNINNNMSPRIVDKELKKKKILQAAMKMFAQKGIVKAKMIDIAKEAGIGKGTIYEYYQSKEEIFEDAFHHFTEQADTEIAKRLFKLDDPIEKLESWIDGWMETIHIHSIDFIEIMIDFWAEGVRNRQLDTVFDMNRIYNEYRITIARILDEGIAKGTIRKLNSVLIASILVAAMDGLALQWVIDRDAFQLKEATKALKVSFIEGIRKNR